jgi:hypothetical protein
MVCGVNAQVRPNLDAITLMRQFRALGRCVVGRAASLKRCRLNLVPREEKVANKRDAPYFVWAMSSEGTVRCPSRRPSR